MKKGLQRGTKPQAVSIPLLIEQDPGEGQTKQEKAHVRDKDAPYRKHKKSFLAESSYIIIGE